MSVLQNFVLFQVGWFACVLGAAYAMPVAGTAVAAAIVVLHVMRAVRPSEETKLIAFALGIGVVLDSTLPALGSIAYPAGNPIAPLAPVWIIALWALFATTLNISLAWLKPRLLLAAVLGAVAGPLSYYGGAKLGALTLAQPTHALATLAIEWALAMPLLAIFARRYDGIAARPAPAAPNDGRIHA